MERIRTRNIVLVFLLAMQFAISGCEDKKYDRDKGPSDIRIENMTAHTFDSVLVNTSGGENYYGSVSAGGQSDYKRFEYAYPKADISLYIDGTKYMHGPVDYTYAVWLGKGKFTYQLDIESEINHTLSIVVVADAPLD